MSLIAVTGGTGTLGQNLVSAMLARGHEVRVLSRRAGAAVAEGASLAVADVLTGQGLDRALNGAEVVIHERNWPPSRSWPRPTSPGQSPGPPSSTNLWIASLALPSSR